MRNNLDRLADSTLSKRFTFLAEDFQSLVYKELYIIASYRIVEFNPDYTDDDGREDTDDDHTFGNSNQTIMSVRSLWFCVVFR